VPEANAGGKPVTLSFGASSSAALERVRPSLP
jgi:hypothetical protein